MADTKLSALTALAVEPADSDELYINDGGTSKRITYGTLKTELLNRANHTGTDSTSLISSLTEVTVAGGDYIMVLDVSTSPVSLKKILASDFATAAQANATHTGDVTGATALSIQPVAISGQTDATASGSDYVLILDTSDSPHTLKKALCSDLGSAFGVTDITGAGAITVAGTDLLVAVDTSASPQVLGQVTAQAVADLFDASGYLPLSGGELTGDITFAAASPEHTVDGRNISADGAKLDGIEAGADVTDTANVTAAGALMDSELADITAIKTLQAPDNTTISTFGASLVDDADAATARTTLDVDQAGTDNSTDVTLAGSLDYLTITGQQITRNAIDLATDVTGNLPAGNLDASAITGQAADSPMAAASGDLLLIADVSVSPISLKQVTAQSVADLAAAGGGDLWSDAVDSDIVPTGADSTYDLGATTDRFAQTYTDTIWITDGDITTSVADGASAVAFDFNNTATLSTAGAKLASFKNNSAEKLYIDKDGSIYLNNGQAIRNSASSQRLNLTSGIYYFTNSSNATNVVFSASGQVVVADTGAFNFTPGAATVSSDTGLRRAAAAVVAVSNGSTGNGALTASYLQTAQAYTVATLPGSPAVGMIARVTDADTPAVGSTVTGGASAAALVWYNGSNWTVIGV